MMKASFELIKAIEDYKNGDQVAFNTIYNESHRYLYVCINNVVSGNDNKEEMICDIMQDTYVEISKHIDSLQNANLFLSWAGTIATRKCYEYIKKTGKYVLLNEDENFDTLADDDNIIPEEVMQNKEKQKLLREIIQNELTEMQKLCIVGYFYNEMKQSEIAKELGIPENSVKSHLLRAKAKIKDAVVDLEKNKDTKLYSVSPLLLLLFADEVQACVVSSSIGQMVLASVGLGGAQVAATSASVSSASTASVSGAATAAKGAVVTFKVKAIAIVSAAVLTVAGVGVGIGIAINNKNEVEKNNTEIQNDIGDLNTVENTTLTETTTKQEIVEETTTKEEDTFPYWDEFPTTDGPREVIESVDSVAGNWATLTGDAFEFIPARGNEAGVYIPGRDIYYKGVYESDNKTYIKVYYMDTSDSQHRGVMYFNIIKIYENSSGKIVLIIEDEDKNMYTLYQAS